jgi:hypothetical protein
VAEVEKYLRQFQPGAWEQQETILAYGKLPDGAVSERYKGAWLERP